MKFTVGLVLLLSLHSCKGKNTNDSKPAASSVDTTQFYQVPQFVEEQIAEVNKTPFYIYKKTITGVRTDSVAINNDEFTDIARQFTTPDINKASLKQHYTENIFFDETTKTYTLNYTTKDRTLEVQNIDVLLWDDAQTLKRIFIRKFFSYNNDSTAIEQLSWKPGEQFQIARMVQRQNEKESTRQTIVVWNSKD